MNTTVVNLSEELVPVFAVDQESENGIKQRGACYLTIKPEKLLWVGLGVKLVIYIKNLRVKAVAGKSTRRIQKLIPET
jgi:hypothetical protein